MSYIYITKIIYIYIYSNYVITDRRTTFMLKGVKHLLDATFYICHRAALLL